METPDCLFPSSNEYGIPDLMPSMQGDFFDYPLSYGSVARQGDYRGHTILFYVDDYRFNSLGNAVEHGSHFQKLWERPDYVWKSGAPSFVEANFSTSDAQAFAVALWQIYKKRFLSRYWQERGMRCWVDLNVSPAWQDLNLVGVPLGWKAYATRVHKIHSLDDIVHQAELAEAHAGASDIKFAVYGHRKEIERLCQREGWIYVNEQEVIWQKRDDSKARRRATSLHTESNIGVEPIEPKRINMTLEAWI
jgi:hypothetical protein